MSARNDDPVFAREASEHDGMYGLAGGGVPASEGADRQRMIDALLALRDEAKAARLYGAAGVLNLTALGLESRRETPSSSAAQLRGLVADDRAREATNTDPEAAKMFGRRAGLYERAIKVLVPRTEPAREAAADVDLCPVTTTHGGEGGAL